MTPVGQESSNQFGPVEKIQLLARYAAMPELNRVDLALLVVLTDMSNAKSGEAWPSFDTLANRVGSSKRHVKRCINKLIASGHVSILKHGGRRHSNRYAVTRHLPPISGDTETTTIVVTATSPRGDIQVPEVVVCTPPESIHQSEHKARIEKNRSQAEGDAAPLRLAAQGSRPPDKDQYPEFWSAYGRKTTVAEAEQIISEAIADGSNYQDIISGAIRYRQYCNTTGGKREGSAAAWLRRQAWRDDWTQPPSVATSKTVGKKSSSSKPKNSGGAKKTRRRKNPAWEKHQAEWDRIDDESSQKAEKLIQHAGYKGKPKCQQCHDAIFENSGGSCCPIGQPLREASWEVNGRFHAFRKLPAPPVYLDEPENQ